MQQESKRSSNPRIPDERRRAGSVPAQKVASDQSRGLCGVAFAAALAVSPALSQSPDLPLGQEFRVNSYTTGFQGQSAVAFDVQGKSVVVWQGTDPQDDGVTAIFGQLYESNGVPAGSEFRVNSYAPVFHSGPDVDFDQQGRFVVSWDAYDSATGSYEVFARRFAGSGLPLAGQFRVNSYTTGKQYRAGVASDDDGNFIVVWETDDDPLDAGNPKEVWARRFDSIGAAIGGDFQLGSGATTSEREPTIASNAVGDFVVAWRRYEVGGVAQRLDLSGPVGAEFQVTNTNVDSIAMDSAGNFIVAWNDFPPGGLVQRFDSVGTALGSAIPLGGSDLSVSTDPTGNFVVARVDSLDGDVVAIVAHHFDPTGSALASPFRVNTYTTDYQWFPAVAADDQGNFLVVWQSEGQDGSNHGVYGQRYLTSRIGDRVFLDTDLDGLQDVDELGQSAVPVHLFDGQSTLLRSTTTGADGNYLFSAVPPGPVFVEFGLPSEWSFTTPDAGGDDGADSDADVVTGETETFAILAGQLLDEWDAGLARGLGDRVWIDDGDGVQEAGEQGAVNVTVELYDDDGALVDSTRTDAEGRYAFDFTGGSAAIGVIVPESFFLTERDAGSDDTVDSDVDPNSGRTGDISIAAGDLETSWDAGLVEFSQISDFLWEDLDGDGIQDPDEPGLPLLSVFLLDTLDQVVASTTTDADGRYFFTAVPDGQYRIQIDVPGGVVPTLQDAGSDDALDSDLDATGVTALFPISNEVRRDVDGGLVELSMVSDFLWQDLDGDGIQQAGEPGFPGMTVHLLDGEEVVLQTTESDDDGRYWFGPIEDGSYHVRVVVPQGWEPTLQDVDADDALDSDLDEEGLSTLFTINQQIERTIDGGFVEEGHRS